VQFDLLYDHELSLLMRNKKVKRIYQVGRNQKMSSRQNSFGVGRRAAAGQKGYRLGSIYRFCYGVARVGT